MSEDEKPKSFVEQLFDEGFKKRMKETTPEMDQEFRPLEVAGMIKPKAKADNGKSKTISQMVAEKLISEPSVLKDVSFNFNTWEEFDEGCVDVRASKVLAAFELMLGEALRNEASVKDLMIILNGFNQRIKKLIRSKDKLTSVIATQYLGMPEIVMRRHKIKERVIRKLID